MWCRRDTLATFLPFLCLRLFALCKRRVRLPPFDGPCIPCIPCLAACICANFAWGMLMFTGVCTGVAGAATGAATGVPCAASAAASSATS